MQRRVGERMNNLKTPQISVVMPVYNGGRYLKETLDSIKRQTFTSYELICVNDHSDDDTQKIIDIYQKNDCRIKGLNNQERKGAAYSRNRGMDIAQGRYIIFLDGDDIFDEFMLEKAYEVIKEKDADLVYFDYTQATSEEIYMKKMISHSERFTRRYSNTYFHISNMLVCDFTSFNTAPWNKLYRTDFIRENKIRFQELPCCNDVYFVLMSFFLAEKMTVLDAGRAMVYFRRHNTVTKIGNNQNPACLFYALEKVQQELINRNLFKLYYEYFYAKCFWMLWSTYKTTIDQRQKKEFYDFLRKDGIRALWKGQEKLFDQISPYMQGQWSQWLNLEGNYMWNDTDSVFRFRISCMEKEITSLLDSVECNRKKSALWGMGACGVALKKFCGEKRIKIDLLFDISREKQGTIIDGLQVQDPRKGLDGVEIIIVTGKGICGDVRAMVSQSGNAIPKIIDFREVVDT